MSTLIKFQRLRANSKTKKNNTIIYLENTPRKIQKTYPTPRRENSRQKCTVSKGISKQTEFRLAVSEHALADNRSINK